MKKEKIITYEIGDSVVYPAHGVGVITGIEMQQFGGIDIEVYAVSFAKERMLLRIPVKRAMKAGLRHLINSEEMDRVLKTLKSKARTSKGMWSRRAKEYESKINSGNIISLAEVVRDLHKNVDDPDRSYSERMIYESALNRLAGEFAAVEKIDSVAATEHLVQALKKVA